MHVPLNESTYTRMHAQLRFLRRRKWPILAALIFCISLAIIFRDSIIPIETHTTERDIYMDDVPQYLYQAVLNKWYNFSDNEKWYNKKNIPTLTSETWQDLLTDIRLDWILWSYNPKESYLLQEPEIQDPSMGQSNAIREIFNDKKKGFFIECGAYDGETRSNTLFLERFNGWSGLLIEADPINFTKMLQKNRRAYLSPTCLSITKYPMVASFLMARNIGRLHDSENITENTFTNSPDVAHTGEHINVQCLPLFLYIAALGIKTVDYFSLDIEGNEIEVLKTIPFDEVDIKALSVEYVHNTQGRKYMIDMMEQRGYYVHSFVEQSDNLANDIIFVKRDI